ncbi:hypothetical protein EST38_g451 [Candolleomyces aberdarensis]|uniref:HIG1 domain-containing protein n=1 Tax=Candolleomyces aberdarensis TaxID=2316362 RepID=A0A4Q2E161_9AGAR|nr:hypothetical protein EST38_g451 [Candolleomyces aberdarensis]
MKLLTQKQIEDHNAASVRGAAEGFLAGSAVAVASALYANRHYAGYRRLPPSLKLLGGIIIVAPLIAVQGERRGLEYDRSQWEGESIRVLDEKELQAARRWDNMTLSQKIGDWSFRHQYTLIMGGWAGSLGIAAAIISRNKYQTYPQKIVQARMWAQGLTVGLLIAAGALTSSSKKEFAKEHNLDHSWRDIIEQQERDRKLEEAALSKRVAHAA